MSRDKRQQRAARRKLKNHDQGLDRHNKPLSLEQKLRRKAKDRGFHPKKRMKRGRTVSDDEVWKSTVDGNTWLVRVVGDKDDNYVGVLEVVEVATGKTVHREPVEVTFGAPFGPDVADVAFWAKQSLDVIDHPEKRIVTP